MGLEIYPTYARRLNFLIRENPERARLWNEVILLADRLMREDNGSANAYPITPEQFVDDAATREARMRIARASERGRWVFLSMAAREILRRETGALR